MQLALLNSSSDAQAYDYFMQCCTSERWVDRMVAQRPYSDITSLRVAADLHWQDLDEADYLQAFDGHPKIGDVASLKAKYANTHALASKEQSTVRDADDDTIQRLASGNATYQQKFGFIFIVCATGKSAAEMLGLLEARLNNDRLTELKNAAEEQRKIFQIRIKNSLTEESPMSQITTHVLDTALGKPAAGIAVELHHKISSEWQHLGSGSTNADGRVANLLADNHSLSEGDYRLHFDTQHYLGTQSKTAFFPYIEIVFHITEDELDQHFHIPILLSPYGYSTYRGS